MEHKRRLCLLMALALMTFSLVSCSPRKGPKPPPTQDQAENEEMDTSGFLVAIEDEPDTVDFQCTSIHYTIAQNVFDRLVEMDADENGNITVRPSLAKAWEVSEDGRSYTFHLRDDVKFSNGSQLNAHDVLYTITRVLTHPDSCNSDIAEMIAGAEKLKKGDAESLEGFQLLGEYDFMITLEQPFEAFLACLSMPGASVLDEESTRAAGSRFGIDPDCTIGTGPFILKKWEQGKGMLLTANEDCWSGAPKCAGLDLRFMTDADAIRTMFEQGKIDILDLDEVGNSAEYFIHGDIYQDRLLLVRRIGTAYIALNQSVEPLNDARVRKALQLGLNRTVLLEAVYSGRGTVENGILPHGLYGFNPDLPEIPYDPEQARALLAEAGLSDGFDLAVSVKSSSTQWEMTLVRLAASMWEKIGVRVNIRTMDESAFMRLRKSGWLACYTALWTADYDDPDNFFYTFFGNRENTTFRSLCYPREEIMERVRMARAITDPDARLREYRELERIIAQEDAAWIPLFSRTRYYVLSERVEGVSSTWNGSVKNNYRYVTVR